MQSKSAGIAQAGGDSADCGGYGAVDFGGVFTGSFAAQHVHLDEVHGIDVWVSQPDGMGENLIFLEQLSLAQHGEDGADGAMELGVEEIVDALAEFCIFNQRRVEAGGGEIDFAERHFNIAQQVYEEGKLAGHDVQQVQIRARDRSGPGQKLFQCEADAEPCGD